MRARARRMSLPGVDEVRRTVAVALADDRVLFGIVAPTLVGLLVAGWNLGGKPLWYDETFEALLVMHPPLRFAGWVATFEASGALYHSLLWLWKFLGTSEVALRLPSVVFSVLAIPVTFVLARRAMSVPWAALAASLLGLSSLWLAHAQEVRPYGLYLLMSLLSTLALIRAVEQPARARWVVYAVITVLAIWSHLMMAFVVLAQALAIAAHPDVRRWWRPAAVSVGLAAAASVPVAISISRANQARWYWITPPTPEGLWQGVTHLTQDAGVLLPLLWLGLWGVGVAIGVKRWLQSRASAWPVVAIAFISIVPIIAPWVLSFIRPMYTPRYILPVLPAMIVLATLGLSAIRPRLAGAALAAVLVVTSGLGVQQWHTTLGRADFRSAVRILVEGGSPSDGLAYFYRGAFEPGALYEYRYYVSQTPHADDRPTMIRLMPGSEPLEQRVSTAVAPYDRLWFVGIPSGTDDEIERLAIAEIERQFAIEGDFDVPGLVVRLYVRPSAWSLNRRVPGVGSGA